ncbi:MAG: hypothetical protein AAF557_03205 [Pseudomonadota bacterium]
MMLAIMGYHGGYPVIESLTGGEISFRALLPPFEPMEVSAFTAGAALGLLRLMALSFSLAIGAFFAGGAVLLVLSIVLAVPFRLVCWIRSVSVPKEPSLQPKDQPEQLDWAAAVDRAKDNTGLPPSYNWAREAGAWTGRTIKKVRNLRERIVAKVSEQLPPTRRSAGLTIKRGGRTDPRPRGAWAQILDALYGPKPPGMTQTSNVPRAQNAIEEPV